MGLAPRACPCEAYGGCQGRQGSLPLRPRACLCNACIEYTGLLAKWSRAYNLTSVRDREQMISAHVLDSLSALPYIKGNNCLDVGTGAGLPGFILALARPEQNWTLLDGNSKKIRFLQQLLFEMRIENVEIVHSRAEKFLSSAPYSSIISRAFGPLNVLYEAVGHLLRPGVRVLAMKGEMPSEELRAVAGWRDNISTQTLAVPGIDSKRNLVILDT